MNNKVVPKDFTLSLAIVDVVPVIFFSMAMILLTRKFPSKLFSIGALLVVFAGMCKVLWKQIVVLKKKNIWFLFVQMRITMPIGMLLIIASLIVNKDMIFINSIIQSVITYPQAVFFILGSIGMLTMLIFAFVLDNKKLINNWIEQIVNSISQICFFIGVILIK